jgi:hypothetical protein
MTKYKVLMVLSFWFLMSCNLEKEKQKYLKDSSNKKIVELSFHPKCDPDGPLNDPNFMEDDWLTPALLYQIADEKEAAKAAICYRAGNHAELSICSAYEYFLEAIAFDIDYEGEDGKPGTTQRLELLHKAMAHLEQSIWYAEEALGGWGPSWQNWDYCESWLIEQSPKWAPHFARMYEEIFVLSKQIADEGTVLSIAVADSLRANYGNYKEQSIHAWGTREKNGKAKYFGFRAFGLGLLHGQPWANYLDHPDVFTVPTLPSSIVDASQKSVKNAMALFQKYGLPLETKEYVYEANDSNGLTEIQGMDYVSESWNEDNSILKQCFVQAINRKLEEKNQEPFSYYVQLSSV